MTVTTKRNEEFGAVEREENCLVTVYFDSWQRSVPNYTSTLWIMQINHLRMDKSMSSCCGVYIMRNRDKTVVGAELNQKNKIFSQIFYTPVYPQCDLIWGSNIIYCQLNKECGSLTRYVRWYPRWRKVVHASFP